MTRFLFLFFLTFVFHNILFAQSTSGVEYNFDTNDGSWYVGEDKDYSAKIENGHYLLSHFDENNTWELFWQEIFIDQSKDFYIETKITQLSGIDTHGFGLAFGGADVNNEYNYLISSSGMFKVYKYEKDELKTINDWSDASVINPYGSPNILGIKKKDNMMHFYINGTEVFSTPFQKFYGLKLGFFLYSKISVNVDYLKVNQASAINLFPTVAGTHYQKENLGTNINTKYEDVMPVISSDGNILYFDRKDYPLNTGGKEYDDIWYSINNNGTWSKSSNIGKPLNNSGHNFVFSASPDGNTLLVANTYLADGSLKGSGVSITHRTASGWELPVALDIKNYYNDHDLVSFALAPNRQVLLMSVKRDDTQGKHDLYVSFLQSDDTWSEPRNLGPIVNSLGDEVTPFLASDGVSLYYSSNGKPGYGDNDIFVSKRLDDTWTNWSEPINLGPEINTKSWDAYYTVQASGEFAYFVSSANSVGEDDVFRIRLKPEEKPNPVVVIYGTVYDKETGKPIESEIFYQDLNTHKEAGEARSAPGDGKYRIVLPYGVLYGFEADEKGYYSESDNIDLIDVKGYKEIKRDLYLTPIKVGNTIKLNNVFFLQSKAELVPTSYPELDKLVKIMKDNPTMKIELAGHTDNIGDPSKNQKLSEQRVLSIKSYLANHGIEPTRVSGKGYGGTKPIANNNTEETRKLNRRVEFIIIHQ